MLHLTCFGVFTSKARAQTPNAIAINRYVSSVPKLPEIVSNPPSSTGPGSTQDLGIIDRRRRKCTTTPMTEKTTLQEIVALDPNAGTVWPGALFHGNSLASGRLTPITIDRAPGSLTALDLQRTGASPAVFTVKMPSPTLESSQSIIHELTSNHNNLAVQQPADIELSISEVHSFDQAMLDTGVSVSWLSGSASASLRTASTKKHHAIVVSFIQRYYSIRFSDPTSPASFFGKNVTLDRVQGLTRPPTPGHTSDPMMFISEVKYGRMALITISSDEATSSLEAAVKASFSSGMSGGSLSLDTGSKSILQNSEIEGLVIGGAAGNAATLLSNLGTGGIDGLSNFIKTGATYDPNTSPGAVISYVARYLDNTVADSAFSADFSLDGCTDSDVPIKNARIAFQTGDDDKDGEMYPFIVIDQGGKQLANVSGYGWDHAGWAHWSDHQYDGPFSFPIDGLTLSSCLNLQATVGQRSTKGTNPGWRTSFQIDFQVDDHWVTVRPMNGNADEFTWGDNHPGQNTVGLTCPQS